MSIEIRNIVVLVVNEESARICMVKELDREGCIAIGVRDLHSARQVLRGGLKPDSIVVIQGEYEAAEQSCQEFRHNFHEIPIFCDYFLDDLTIKFIDRYLNTKDLTRVLLNALEGGTVYRFAQN